MVIHLILDYLVSYQISEIFEIIFSVLIDLEYGQLGLGYFAKVTNNVHLLFKTATSNFNA